ncbi:siderophore-interacting protein [Marinomonas sp. 5E14-1]|uniref:siderophore-interacting protein n=1 Tax=Marinomonas sp. 5E14-1 TaxID=3153922 RepID=UPI003263C3B3
MSRPQPRKLIIIKKRQISPHMLRVTLGGDEISTIPEDQESGYVKLIFPNGEEKPLMRTYTIRHQRPTEIDVDFVLHEDSGPASSWAQNSKVGDSILIGGPGSKRMIHMPSDWYLLASDMTGLPALSVNLEQLPDSAIGYAVIEIINEKDKQPLNHPKGIEIFWLENDSPGEKPDALLNQIKRLDWLEGSVGIWAACEFSSMKNLRRFFKQEKHLDRQQMYISSYWKQGINEDQHKVEKSKDAELNEI